MPDIDPATRTRIIAELSRPFVKDPDYADDFYRAIGKLLFAWSQLEYCLDELLTFVTIMAEPLGYSYSTQVALGKKLKLLNRIYKEIPQLTTTRELIGAISKLVAVNGRYRNSIIHSRWKFVDSDPPSLTLDSFRKDDTGKTITVSEMTLTVTKIMDIADGFHRARAHLRSAYHDAFEISKTIR